MQSLAPVVFALIALVAWGVSGITQKACTNEMSAGSSFVWFTVAMLFISAVIVPFDLHGWEISRRTLLLALAGGLLNGLGVLASFAALERGGKASIVIPLTCLYPLVTIALAVPFLREALSIREAFGVVFAIASAILLAQEGDPRSASEARGAGDA